MPKKCNKKYSKENCRNCRYNNWEYDSCMLTVDELPDEDYLDALEKFEGCWEENDY